jgi:divalent metal cation (Fe/Co/Zn/Cd) transporter
MAVEFGISLYAGIQAHSVALTAFGADSAIELFSALVVVRRFALGPSAERWAARLSGFLLYALAAYILITSALSLFKRQPQPEPTVLGIAILAAAAVIMPLLGRAKKRLAVATASRALRADAAQSNICAYMSWIALAGLLLNFLFHIPWTDPAAALLLLPIVLSEAREAAKGEVCESC